MELPYEPLRLGQKSFDTFSLTFLNFKNADVCYFFQVFACSLITNLCVVEYGTGIETNHEEVMLKGQCHEIFCFWFFS
jgi:hypothetical protein